MKILMLTPYLPYPLLSGGQTRSYNLLKNLAKDHQITLFSFIRETDERKYQEKLLRFCLKVKTFQRRPAWSLFNILLAAFTPYPFIVAIYLSRSLKKALKDELRAGSYDLIHAETFYVMPNIPPTQVPILLVEQTIEYRVYQHFVETSTPRLIRPLLWLDVAKLKHWEKYFWAKASRVIAMSEADREKMRRVLPELTVDIVPNGVDVTAFKRKRRKQRQKPTVLYVGNFKWLQNREAVKVLVKDVWPRIKEKVPDVRLWIVGRGQTKELKRLKSIGVVFDETVDDIHQAYQDVDLLLAPIRGPGGTRLKILEAMASGCPVVTTPVGIEGIVARNKREVLVGKTSAELARLAVEILRNTPFRYKLTQRATKLVREKYNWVDITKKLGQIYQEVGGCG